MRISSYAIWLPLGTEKELLIHGYTGAAAVLDLERAQQLRQLPPEFDRSEIDLPEEQVDQLVGGGFITERNQDRELRIVSNLAESIHRRSRQRAIFVVMPSMDCNLRCPYCYQRDLQEAGGESFTKVMDGPQIEAMYAAMKRLAGEGAEPGWITLYGGEPLRPGTQRAVEEIVTRGEELGYRFSAITNAVSLSRFRHLLGPTRIARLQITIDGPPSVHDQRRIGINGNGTFSAVANSVDLALSLGVQVSVRTNVDRVNFPVLDEMVAIFHERGWLDAPNFSSYVRPVHFFSLGDAETVRHLELAARVAEIRAQYPGKRVLEHGGDVKGKLINLLRSGAAALTSSYCGANTGEFLFDASGDLYACWDVVGAPSNRIGTYYPALDLDQEVTERWFSRSVTSMPGCRTCQYALLCGGGCGYAAMQETGDPRAPSCDAFPELLAHYAAETYQAAITQAKITTAEEDCR